MIDMIGVGPFITIPLMVTAMGGPQAMLGWILGALFAMCDGLVWAELGAAMPRAGGSYYYLKEIYGPKGLGRLLSFLFVWQLSFSAPLSIASGCVGLGRYAGYLWPGLIAGSEHRLAIRVPLLGPLAITSVVNGGTLVAIAACVLVVALLYRRITMISRLSAMLAAGVLGTVGWVIISGFRHFNAARAFSFPPGAFALDSNFFLGLGAAMLVATYDYWGYYNVCFLGEEVEKPERNIPRALILSIALVAVLYLAMNISILGVVPWRELQNVHANTRYYVVSTLMERLYGRWAGSLAAVLIMWTAFASVFSLLLGYSRVPYAAALDGNYFRVFAKLHPRGRFPYISVLALGAVASAACFLRLDDLISKLVVIRIMMQFLLQTIGVMVLRVKRPDMPRPFRIWLYPVPALLATAGFLFVLIERPNFANELRWGAAVIVLGTCVFLLRSAVRKEWPFAAPRIRASN
ncbi:MAG: amino acid permease [Acidobacteria bacterium]|nr:amino acid permease [Acidobacteriota bacterium]